MLRYKTETRPGLVALYDIRQGNGAGQFLQPRSLDGADKEGQFLFQGLSVALQRFNAILLHELFGVMKTRTLADQFFFEFA